MTAWVRRSLLVLSLCAGLAAAIPRAASAGGPPADDQTAQPILRIETGAHMSGIAQVGVDDANRYVVTGSPDRTVRVWDLKSGTLLRIIRPPIAEGDEGKIYALAFAPDGRTIACAGATGRAFEGSLVVYLFDRASGRLIRRLTDLPTDIHHLAFSPDGRFLAATFGPEPAGLRIYRASDWSLLREDLDYGDVVLGVDFDRTGRFVTSSYDGFIRLYDTSFRVIAKVPAPGGKKPRSVSFAPDGSEVAIAFDDVALVAVLSGVDLASLVFPDMTGVEAVISSVAWAAEGGALYAAGSYGWPRIVRKWTDGGRGVPRDLTSAAYYGIRDLRGLKSGGVVYGSHDPVVGVFDVNDSHRLLVSPSVGDIQRLDDHFQVSRNAEMVAFAFGSGMAELAMFNVMRRVLERGHPSDGQLTPPRTSAPGLEIADWDWSAGPGKPQLNGRPLALLDHEKATSLAIAPDARQFLLGTKFRLRLFNRTGEERWQIYTPGFARAVNIAGNGHIAVAAFADGTIRWYRMSDGRELLALFPHPDQKRWVLWTPSGYYDASPGAEDLIGWHVNRGKESAADFFPVGHFRGHYYRPDVIAKVLETRDEGEALRLVNAEAGLKAQQVALVQQLPPVVIIHTPLDGTEVSARDLPVTFTVRSPSGEPPTGIKVLVDGRPVETRRDLVVSAKSISESGVQEVRVPIPERDAEIAILAENRHATSEPARVRVRWRGPPVAGEFVIKPKLYVLAIGVSRYHNKDLTLGLAAKDAQDFAAVLQQQQGGLYREVVAKVLIDQDATKDEVLDGLEWLQRQTTSKDVAMVFLAGHGVNDPHGVYYFLPVNANPEKLKRTGVAFSDIKNTVASLAGKALFFVDTCHAGNVMGTRRGLADLTAVVNELASAENGAVVFAASTGNQYSLEDPAWENGAFTKALVEGLSGKADYSGTGKITINMLDLYLSERVKELTRGKQTPTTTKPQTIPDFPVTVKRG